MRRADGVHLRNRDLRVMVIKEGTVQGALSVIYLNAGPQCANLRNSNHDEGRELAELGQLIVRIRTTGKRKLNQCSTVLWRLMEA